MPRTDEEVQAALELHAKLKTNGLFRAIELMGPTERSYARRTICHALQAFVAPQATGLAKLSPLAIERLRKGCATEAEQKLAAEELAR